MKKELVKKLSEIMANNWIVTGYKGTWKSAYNCCYKANWILSINQLNTSIKNITIK